MFKNPKSVPPLLTLSKPKQTISSPFLALLRSLLVVENTSQPPTGVLVVVVVVRLGFQILTLSLTRFLSNSVGDDQTPSHVAVAAVPTAERPRRHRFPLLPLDRSTSLFLSSGRRHGVVSREAARVRPPVADTPSLSLSFSRGS